MTLASHHKSTSSLSLPSLIHTPSDTDTDTDTDQNTDSDSDIDLDILEEIELDITDYDSDPPTRPVSRLGFNRALIQGQHHMEDSKQIDRPSQVHSMVTPRWTRSLLRDVNTQVVAMLANTILDSDKIETCEDARNNPAVSLFPSSSVSETGVDTSSNSSIADDEDMSSDDSYSNETILRFPTPPWGSSQPKPMACGHVPFPLIRSSVPPQDFEMEHTPKSAPSPPIFTSAQGRQKFSCLPSPLSPMYSSYPSPLLSPFFAQIDTSTVHPSPTPFRHSYANRGHSRNALLHLKHLWSVRHDEWMDYECECASSESPDVYPQTDIFSGNNDAAYGGLQSQTPSLPMPPSRSGNIKKPSMAPHAPTPLTIHPRTGDLSALRDPYCMLIDVFFAGLPLWTLGKTLWMFEVHRMDGGKCAKVDGRETDIRMTSSSMGLSESCDVTLVEDGPTAEPALLEMGKAAQDIQACSMDADVDADVNMNTTPDDEIFFEKYLLDDVDFGDAEKMVQDLMPQGLPFHASATQAQAVDPHTYLHKRIDPTPNITITLSKELSTHQTPQHITPTRTQPLELTWYSRWELLVELVRRDEMRGQGVVPGPVPGRDKSGRRMFYLGADDDCDDEGSGHMDVDDDEEEDDYGVLVANPVYPPSRVFDTGISG